MTQSEIGLSIALALSGSFLFWILQRNIRRLNNNNKFPGVLTIAKGKALVTQNSRQFSVVSYNILAKCNARSSIYRHTSQQYLAWEYRWGRLQRQLTSMKADVVCLQEVGVQEWEEVSAYFTQNGYTCILQDKRKSEGNNKATFTLAIAFARHKFECTWSEIRSRTMAIRLTPIHPNDGLRHQDVYVVNMHLEGEPSRGADRVNQIKSVLGKMQRKQESEGLDPYFCNVLICGDLNEGPKGAIAELLYRGRLPQGYSDPNFPDIELTKETVAHPYALKDVHDSSKFRVPFTRKSTGTRVRIDFIWCSRHLTVAALRRIVEQEEWRILCNGDMPNRIHPSDHLPIAAILEISSPSNSLQ